MTAGTQQYTSRNGTTTTMSGAADLTITAASDKVQLVDPGGSSRNLDLLFVDTSETGVTTSFCEVYIQNEADGAETLTIRDGNNSDNVLSTIDQNYGAHFAWDGTGWVSSSGAT